MTKYITHHTSHITHQIVLILFVVFCTPLSAQTSLLGIGLRGGGQMNIPSAAEKSTADVRSGLGGVGGVDLRYTFYSCIGTTGIGFTVGAGFGYGSTALKGTNTDQYTNMDYLSNRIDYTIDSKFRQTDKFAQANASLMLALCFGNFTINVGPRFMLPISPSSNLTIEEAHINAYYPTYDVNVTDQMITGVLATPYTQSVSSFLPKYNVLMGAEIGYEFGITDKTFLGFQLFADIAVWSQYTQYTIHNTHLIAVGNISDSSNPVPAVSVNSLNGQIAGMRYMDFGLRAYIAFSVGKNSEEHAHLHFNSRRDTKYHRNRYRWW